MSEFEPGPPPPSSPGQHTVTEPVAAAGEYVPPAAAPETPAPKKSRSGAFLIGAFSGCLVFSLVIFVIAIFFAAGRKGSGELSLSTNKVAIVPIEGEIFESRDTIEALHRYARNSSVKAIVIRINSPGGAIAPSQEIYSEIRKLDKPVIASMDSVAASGGYYIAAACDEIVANPGSITGSIGVILQWLELEDLVRWAKMKPETITSGAMKAAGSPYQKLTEAERQYLQRIVLQLHSQFVRAIAQGRTGKISEADVAKLADGRVFTGEEALSLKLVDRLGNLDDAVRLAGQRAGIRGEPSTIYPRRRDRTLIDLLTDTGESKSLIDRIVRGRAARFLYMWEAAQGLQQ
jgi:protease IV